MSCEHELMEAMSKDLTKAVIVLTKNDLYKIRTGRIREVHFHGRQLYLGRITFFITDEKNKVQKDSKIGKLATEIGEVAPIVIDKQRMKQLQNGEVFGPTIPTTPPVEVYIMTAETYHRLHTEKENKP